MASRPAAGLHPTQDGIAGAGRRRASETGRPREGLRLGGTEGGTVAKKEKQLPPLTPAQQQLAADNVRLPYWIAKKYRFVGASFDLAERNGVAVDALIVAAAKFDPDRGVRFTTFAAKIIANAILREKKLRGYQKRAFGLGVHQDPDPKRRRPERAAPVADLRHELTEARRQWVQRRAPSLLSSREIEVLSRQFDGESLLEIGERLGVSRARIQQIGAYARDRLAAFAEVEARELVGEPTA